MLMPEELASRRLVWVALSDLWLDTELQESDLAHIASALNQSGYSLAQIRAIHLDEVAPVLFPNLLSVAGVWGGFDEEWLCEAILQRLRHIRPARLSLSRVIRKSLVRYATGAKWQRLEQMLADDFP
jgi:hypothetical protein